MIRDNTILLMGFVIAILILLLYGQTCQPVTHIGQDKIVRDTVWRDTVIYKTSYVPKPVYIKKPTDTLWIFEPGDTLYQAVDTAEILKDYASLVFYRDTIRIDSSWVVVNDSVQYNRIINRSWKASLYLPVVTERTIERRRKFMVGAEIIGNQINPINYVGINGLYLDKKDWGYEVGAGATNQGLNFKIGLKKVISFRK